jgi:N-methylhydantoinase B
MPDPILLEILKSQFTAVADEMGVTLGRTAYSPNIKERRDYSCAVFDPCGDMVAQAAHIPVHLGAMPLSVQACLQRFKTLDDGDIAVLNDPFAGGSHLPDITMISPVYRQDTLLGYVASRAHHADVGGMTPGSMPLARELFQEGLIIPPVKLQRRGELDESVLDLITRNSRTPAERLGDLSAQIAAQRVGIRRLQGLAERYGVETIGAYMLHLQDYAEALMRALLAQIPAGIYTFEDVLDDDGFGHANLPIRVTLRIEKTENWMIEPALRAQSSNFRNFPLTIDFTGTAPQTEGGVNAVFAVTLSAVFYVLRCLLDDDSVPTNAGIFRPVEVIAPEGTLVNARFPASVAAGNVETSQRITDVLLGAFAKALPGRVPAASQGTMNNLTIGGETEKGRFAYYETIAGGMGASAGADGLSGVHTHMTNTLNTPCEALEYAYPLRVTRYHLRRGSGGNGKSHGGNGIYREIELLADATVTILAERRTHKPYGLAGGEDGLPGENVHIYRDERTPLPGKITFRAQRGDKIGIATPGGGGYGCDENEPKEAIS